MKLYHIVPESMTGNTLYPLRMMKDINSEIYKKAKRKYLGRKDVEDTYIPTLKCYWPDVINMFAVPTELIQKRNSLRGAARLRFFEIESNCLDQGNMCMWLDDFLAFEPVDELCRIPEQYGSLFEARIEKRMKAPLFMCVPHILYKGTIDVSECPVKE